MAPSPTPGTRRPGRATCPEKHSAPRRARGAGAPAAGPRARRRGARAATPRAARPPAAPAPPPRSAPRPRPWLCTVARNIAVDAHRSRQARPPEVGPDALAVVAVPDDADRVLESWIIGDALRALSPEHRDVIVETYFRGKSVAEAAASLRIPAGTVKSRTYYALRALRLALTERGVTS